MWAPSICWAARSPRTWRAISWNRSRFPPPVPWAYWWTVTRASRPPAGYLIQLMPGAGEDVITKVEGGIMAAGPVSALLDKNDDPEQLLRDVM